MLSQVLSHRTYRICLLSGVGILTIVGILISFNTTLAYSSRSLFLDSSRKELLDSVPSPPKIPGTPAKARNGELTSTYKSSTCRSSAWGPEWTVDSNGGVCRHGEIGPNGCCHSAHVESDKDLIRSSTDTLRIPLSVSDADSETHATPSATAEHHDRPNSLLDVQDPKELSTSNHKENQEVIIEEKPTCSSEHQCCAQYEFCVSSCLDFTWQRSHRTTVSARVSKSDEFDSVERLVGEHQAGDKGVAGEFVSMEIFDWCLARCRTSGRSVVHQNSFRSNLKHCYGTKDPPLLARNIEKGETL